jgi:hypothetical protein
MPKELADGVQLLGLQRIRLPTKNVSAYNAGHVLKFNTESYNAMSMLVSTYKNTS